MAAGPGELRCVRDVERRGCCDDRGIWLFASRGGNRRKGASPQLDGGARALGNWIHHEQIRNAEPPQIAEMTTPN